MERQHEKRPIAQHRYPQDHQGGIDTAVAARISFVIRDHQLDIVGTCPACPSVPLPVA